MKYVVTAREDGTEEIFTFPDSVNHDVFYTAISRLKNQSHGRWERISRELVAAGFTNGYDYCDGYSHSLDIGSRGYDDAILLKGLK